LAGCVTAHAAETRGDLPVCTHSSTDTVANRSRSWLRLIALLGLVKPSTFTKHDHEPAPKRFVLGTHGPVDLFQNVLIPVGIIVLMSFSRLVGINFVSCALEESRLS
jgi:hypothetical protein